MMKKRIMGVLLAMVTVFALLPAAAWAAEEIAGADEPMAIAAESGITYLDWESSQKKLVEKTCDSATEVDSTTTTWETGWYVVSGSVTISSRITVTGDVHLILEDDCNLKANKGIEVSGENSLTICGQAKQSGSLSIPVSGASNSMAGIGGNSSDGGTITINGGNITAKGGSEGAGIGGGENGSGGTVTINGGTVEANGGILGAGIGGGENGSGGIITINGGNITAKGGNSGGAGIGGGENGSGGTVTINGGEVTTTGGSGAGIGGGEKGDGEAITINGGKVTAKGGSYGAGIGGGESGSGGTIKINGGNITATGASYAAGIGGGRDGKGGTVEITGGTVIAKDAGGGSDGIGGGALSNDSMANAGGGSFSTGAGRNAVIDASSISDMSQQDSWSGIIFNGNTGEIYDTPVSEYDFNIQSGKTLNVHNGQTLHIGAGVMMTNSGTVNIGDASNLSAELNNEGMIINKKTIDVWGQLTNSETGITNQGGGQIVYHFNLDITPPTFEKAKSGYARPEAQSITIKSTDDVPAKIVSVVIDGEDFELNEGTKAELENGASDTSWTIQPKEGLSAGEHTATITVTYSGSVGAPDKTATAEVSFTVANWAEGSGTKLDPYLIPDLPTLEAFRDYINDGKGSGEYFKVTENIEMSDEYGPEKKSWEPIGNTTDFQGTFDGAGHTISGLYINAPEESSIGLFGDVGSSGTVENLTVSGSVTGGVYTGGIVGENNGTISDCRNDCDVKGTSNYIGGIAGYNSKNCIIKNCYNTGTISNSAGVNDNYVGGISPNNHGTIENCYNAGTVNNPTGEYTGGVTGENGGSIKNCYNTGTVNGYAHTGGITGYNSGSGSSVENCCNTGAVVSEWIGINSGAIAGSTSNGGSVENCYYLDSSCTNAGKGTSKTEAEFNSGEVAWLLQNGQDAQVWGQKLGDGVDAYPVLTDEASKKVLKVTFATNDNKNYAARYTNPNETVTLPDDPEKANYTFEKWAKTQAADGEKFDETTAVTGDMTVYAVGREHFGGESNEIVLSGTYGYTAALTIDLDKHMAYANTDITSEGKFEYEVSDQGGTKAEIRGNTLSVPVGLGAGDYAITVTVHEKAPQYSPISVGSYGTDPVTLTVKVTINKATATVTPPTAKTPLTYNGEEQALITEGSAASAVEGCGEMQYSLTKEGSYSTAIPKGKETGTYTVYWKVEKEDTANYEYSAATNGQVMVTIGKSDADVTGDSVTITYGQDVTLTVNVAPKAMGGIAMTSVVQNEVEFVFPNEETKTATVSKSSGENGTATITIKANEVKNYFKPGENIVTVNYGGSGNLNEKNSVTMTVTVNKKPLDFTLAATDRAYNGSNVVTGSLTPTGLVGGDSVTATLQKGGATADSADAGMHNVTVDANMVELGGDDAGYYMVGTVDGGTVTINKAPISNVTPPTADDRTYDGTEKALVTAPAVTEGGTMKYALSENGEFGADIPQAKDAGTYYVWYYVEGDDNHNDSGKNKVSVTIAKAAPTVNAPAAENLTYTGLAQRLIAAGRTEHGIMMYSVGDTAPGDDSQWKTDASQITGINAETYYVWWKVSGDENHTDTEPACITVTIAKAAPEVTAPAGKALTYNGSAQDLVTAGTASGGEMRYSLDDTAYSAGIPTAVNAGTYSVYYKVVGDANHYDTEALSVSVTIAPAEVSFTIGAENKATWPSSETNGDPNPDGGYKIEGDTLTMTYDSFSHTANVTQKADEAVKIGAGAANGYTVTYKKGDAGDGLANVRDAGTYGIYVTINPVTDDIYNFKFAGQGEDVHELKIGEITVEPYEVTVIWTHLSYVYHAHPMHPDIRVQDAFNADRKQMLPGKGLPSGFDVDAPESYTGEYLVAFAETEGSDAGEYTVTAKLYGRDAGNYTVKNPTATVTIVPAPVTFTVSDNVWDLTGTHPSDVTLSPVWGVVSTTPDKDEGSDHQYPDPGTAIGESLNAKIVYKKGGEEVAPTEAGTYEVWVEIGNKNFRHSATSDGASHKVGELVLTNDPASVRTYKVTFDAGYEGGTAPEAMEMLLEGQMVILPAGLTREGHLFQGWSYGGITYRPNEEFPMPASDVTFKAEWLDVEETRTVGGMVVQEEGGDTKPLLGATVILKQGDNEAGETITDAEGNFSFDNLKPGIYNLEIRYFNGSSTVVKTFRVDVEKESMNETYVLPAGALNTVVEADVTAVVDMQDIVKEPSASDADGIYTNDDVAIVDGGGTVEFKMTVKGTELDDDQTDELPVSENQIGMVLDLKLTKTVTSSSGTDTTEINDSKVPITTVIHLPAEIQGKSSYIVYRFHGVDSEGKPVVQTITTSQNANGEYLQIIRDGTAIEIHATLYSTYVLTWYQRSGGGAAAYPVTLPESVEHGDVSANYPSAAPGVNVTLTVTPDDGYELDELTVTDRNGNIIHVTDNGDGTFTFVMPSSGVEVEAAFVPACKRDETCPIAKFTDAKPTAWYHDGVHYCVERALMLGTSATTFAPDMPASRAMVATILWREADSPVVNYALQYDDVGPETWYTEAIRWATSEGVMDGYGNGKFGPDDTVTREQMAAILYRYAGYKGYDMTKLADMTGYTDAEKVSSWAATAMRWAVAEGIIEGTSPTALTPSGASTRAQIATVFMRFDRKIVK